MPATKYTQRYTYPSEAQGYAQVYGRYTPSCFWPVTTRSEKYTPRYTEIYEGVYGEGVRRTPLLKEGVRTPGPEESTRGEQPMSNKETAPTQTTAIGPWLVKEARYRPWEPIGKLAKTVQALLQPGEPFPRTSRQLQALLPESMHGVLREAQREHRKWLELVTAEEPPDLEVNPFARAIWLRFRKEQATNEGE